MKRTQVLIAMFALAVFAVYAVFSLETGNASLFDKSEPLGNTQVDILFRVEIFILLPVLFLGALACARYVKRLFP